MFLILFLNYRLILFNSYGLSRIFNPIVELVIPTEILYEEAKTEIEIHPAIAEAKMRKCLI